MILRFLNKYFLLIGLFCVLPFMLQAQEGELPASDTTIHTPSEAGPGFTYIPEELRIGLDLSRIAVGLVNPETRFTELNADLRFGRYYLSADVGRGRLERNTDMTAYQVNGTYLRVGPDINLIPGDEDGNTMFLGLRYGHSWYRERLNTVYEEATWGSFPVVVNRNARSGWFEAVAGMKARVWNNLYLGYTLRLKFGLMAEDRNNFVSYEVPGFGVGGEGSNFSFNYHVFYRIPFSK
jgi:hypothetical protein